MDELEKTGMRYCAIEDYFEQKSWRSEEFFMDGEGVYGAIKYLAAYCEWPKLELAVKWGLDDIVKELLQYGRNNGRIVNWKADTPWDFLKISKAEWGAYRASDFAGLDLIRARQRWIKLPMGELLRMLEGLPYDGHWLHYAKQIHDRGVPLKEQIKYVARQERDHDRDFTAWLRLWVDYLNMAEMVGRDVSRNGAIMPRDLPEAHDQMVELQRMQSQAARAEAQRKRAEAIDQEYRNYKKRRKALERKYAFRLGDLEIRVPAGAEEIIREGNVLRICVAGYTARHLNGSTTILFLRHARKPDTPYVCIEIDQKDNRIIQIHGYQNEGYMRSGRKGKTPRQRHAAFLDTWLAWVKDGSKRDREGKPVIKQEVKTA